MRTSRLERVRRSMVSARQWRERPPVGVGICLGAFAVVAPLPVAAGAFYIPQQSIDGVGRAFVGNTAVARDAATVFANPAGMTMLDGPEITVGASGLFLDLDLDNSRSTASAPGTLGAGAPLSGNDGGSPIDPRVVPNLYLALPVVDRDLWFGIGLTMPFGISVEYKDDWFGRYNAIESSLTVVNIGPVVGYRVTDVLSIGGGIDIQYADAKLINAIPDPFVPGGPTAASDGRSKLTGDDWAWGVNAGVLLQPSEKTRVGLHYRSAIDYNIEGTARIRTPASFGGTTSTRDAETDLDLPDVVSLDIAHQLTPSLTLLAGGSWFAWSRFDELRIKTDDLDNEVTKQGYRNSITAGVAAECALTDAWTLRTGFQYDQSPTRNATRNTGLPDGDRYWLAAGVGFAPTAALRFDVAYAHTFFEEVDIDQTQTFFAGTPAQTTARTRAQARNSGDTVAARLLYRF